MRQTGAKIRRKQRADALLASATHIAQVAAEERAADRLEVLLAQPESAKDLKAAEEQQLAGSAGRNSYRRLHRPQAAFRISNKTCFLPRVAASDLSLATGACYSTRNRRVNMQMPPASANRRTSIVIRAPQMRTRLNIRRSCTVQALSLRLVRPIE